MTRQNILDDFLENILKESIEIFNESHLKTPLNLNECVNPVCLPQFNDAHPWGHKVITSGWYPSF